MANILIVDDLPVIRRTLAHILQRHHHTTRAVTSGDEALVEIAKGDIDLALIDLAMPVMDGITLLKHIRTEPSSQKLPVIMITASGQDQDRLNARAAGANGFLTKPVSSWELLDTIQEVLGTTS